jgi:hypothetical protein
MAAHPQHFVNYEPEGVTVDGKVMPKPSAIVPIPLRQASMLSGAPDGSPPPSLDAIRPASGQTPSGSGRLRSIDGK